MKISGRAFWEAEKACMQVSMAADTLSAQKGKRSVWFNQNSKTAQNDTKQRPGQDHAGLSRSGGEACILFSV